MEKLTIREEEVMEIYWEHGPLFVRELLEIHSEPKRHFNTLSTIVRSLEEKGFLSYNSLGNSHQYYPIVSKKEHSNSRLKGIVSKYFNNSFLTAVSSLVKEEEISLAELKELIEKVENQK